MMLTKQQLELVLEVLDTCTKCDPPLSFFTKVDELTKTVKQAIADYDNQEAVAFLVDATRFKIREGCITNLPTDLEGKWVALVAADNDCHLKPQPKRVPMCVDDIEKLAIAEGRDGEDYHLGICESGSFIAGFQAAEKHHGVTE